VDCHDNDGSAFGANAGPNIDPAGSGIWMADVRQDSGRPLSNILPHAIERRIVNLLFAGKTCI
jgi:hypothetical protein